MTPETEIHELKVGDYMTTKLIAAPYDIAFSDALRLMATNHIGNLIIMGEILNDKLICSPKEGFCSTFQLKEPFLTDQ